MIRFPFLEKYGVTAIMSDVRDGDCCSRENAKSFLALENIAAPGGLNLVNQVHGVHIVESRACDGSVEADGIISNQAEAVLGIRVADCVPILMYDPINRAAAAIHAGREGTHRGIAGEAVRALIDRYGCDPADVVALIGPSAGPCCYEVGDDMRQEFVQHGGVSDATCLDLWISNRNQLLNMGVSSKNIGISGVCTICSDEFHSYRKTKTASRNLAILALPRL